MDKLLFSCEWSEDRENSWSGTHMSLYKALQKYFKIEDFDTGYANNCDKLKVKICYFFVRVRAVFFHKHTIGMTRVKVFNSIARSKFKNQSLKCLQFDDCPNQNNISSYIYQDMNIEYAVKMAEEMPEIFARTEFHVFSKKELIRKARRQKEFYQNATAVLTMGNWLAKSLVKEYGIDKDKVFHVGGGCNVDPSLVDYTKKRGNKILFIGRNFERKNGPLVIEAFLLAKKSRPDIELFIAGPDKFEVDDSSIHVLGNLGFDELPQYYNMCDVFCMPSKFEAYGLVFAEALIYGLPCIGRDAYEMPYFIEDGVTGALLKDESASSLAKLMIDTLENDMIKKNVIDRKEWYLKEYSWDSVAKRIADIINGDAIYT